MDVNTTIDKPRFDIHRPFRERLPLPPGKRFHIFFSYTNVLRDKLWVKRVIAKLEKEYGFTCCDHERDFSPGTKIIDNIKDGVMNSEKVVVVFSKESIDSYYVSLEAEMAFKRSLETRKNLVIPILLDDCDVPEEFLLLTYIDAREDVEETTWWPKLMKSIESSGEASRSPFYVEGKNVAAVKTFAISQLCSIETKYNFLRCRIEENPKYIPEKLRKKVPNELTRATKEKLLQSPGVVGRQKMSCFARITVVIGYLIFAFFLFYLVLGIYFFVYPSETYKTGPFIIACIFLFVPCYCTWRLYITVPVELIRARNEDLLQSPGVVLRQAISFFARMDLAFCILKLLFFVFNLVFGIYFFVYPSETDESKPYIIVCFFYLCTWGPYYFTWRCFITPIGEHNLNSVHNNIIDYNRILSKYGVMVTVVPGYMWRTVSLLFYKCRFELCKEYVIRHLVNEGSTNKTEHNDIPDNEQINASDDGSSLLSVAGKHIRRRRVKQSIQIVNEINPVMTDVAEDVSHVADDKPLLSNQGTENLDYEIKALELLMSCTPEYLHLVYANKLKIPREDRHGIEFMCLCQYLEEANEDFREAVKRAKSMGANYQDEANKHLKNLLL